MDGWTINLAYYELGNAVWKQVNIHKKITTNEAEKVFDSLMEAFKRLKKPKNENAKTGDEAIKVIKDFCKRKGYKVKRARAKKCGKATLTSQF